MCFKVMVMDLVDSDKEKGLEVKVWKEYENVLEKAENKKVLLKLIPRFDFYERSKKAFAIIHSG
jgi:L-fucose mutarotase